MGVVPAPYIALVCTLPKIGKPTIECADKSGIQMRKSSIHFKQVSNASVAIAHSTRTEEKEPAYLLPKEHRLGNVIVPGSMSNIDLGLEFTRAKDSMTGQAKARKSSPFWEGVIVLDGTDLQAQTDALQVWKRDYEKATGHKVLHMAIHGDEGFINSEGKPEYNIHAHVIVNRLNDKGRVIKLERKQLSEVQDLTAKSLGMQRGETLEDRKGMRGRKHLNHREFKKLENEKRLDAEHNIAAIQTLKIDVSKEQAEGLDLKGQIAQLKAEYASDRAALKASGEATQKAYQALKIKHEAMLQKAVLIEQERNALAQENKTLKAKNAQLEAKLAPAPVPVPAPPRPPVPAFSVLIIENTSTAAFEDLGRNEEAAQIVLRAAATIEQGWNGEFDLRDTNGNAVGTFLEVARLPNPPPEGAIQIVMPRNPDLVGTLRACATKLREMVTTGVEMVKDAMGKTIAQLTVTPPAPAPENQPAEPDDDGPSP